MQAFLGYIKQRKFVDIQILSWKALAPNVDGKTFFQYTKVTRNVNIQIMLLHKNHQNYQFTFLSGTDMSENCFSKESHSARSSPFCWYKLEFKFESMLS